MTCSWPEVVACDVDESLLDENGKLCLDKAKLIVYSHGEYLSLGKSWAPSGTACEKETRKTEKMISTCKGRGISAVS